MVSVVRTLLASLDEAALAHPARPSRSAPPRPLESLRCRGRARYACQCESASVKRAIPIRASFFRLYQESAICLILTSEGATKSLFEISSIDFLLNCARFQACQTSFVRGPCWSRKSTRYVPAAVLFIAMVGDLLSVPYGTTIPVFPWRRRFSFFLGACIMP
jgi:hypothetical protein